MNIGSARSWGGRIASLLVMAAGCMLYGQTDRGAIEGTLTDESGAAVPNAKVQIINVDTNSTLEFQSNELGNYLAPNLPLGAYRLIVQKQGFRSVVREPILVRAQSRLRVVFGQRFKILVGLDAHN